MLQFLCGREGTSGTFAEGNEKGWLLPLNSHKIRQSMPSRGGHGSTHARQPMAPTSPLAQPKKTGFLLLFFPSLVL